MQPIQLTAYQSDWQKQAIEYQTLLRQQLQANLLKSSHVGSTAMPQLLARPTIDLALLVKDQAAAVATLHARPVAGTTHTYATQLAANNIHVIITTD